MKAALVITPAIAPLGKRSTFNAQLSTFNRSSFALKVERWKLNVERLPILLPAVLFGVSVVLIPRNSSAQDAPKPHRPLPSILQWEASGAQRDPLMGIDHHMGNIVDDLTDEKTDQPVQSQQKQVVADLDVMIKQLEEQMKS